MKPGDLVTIRSWNITYAKPITYVVVYDRISEGDYLPRKERWVQGEIGVLLDGRDDAEETVQVLLKGRAVWIYEEMLRAVEQP